MFVDDRRAGAPARADSVVLDGRVVALPPWERAKNRCTSRSSRLPASSIRCIDRESARHMGAAAAHPDDGASRQIELLRKDKQIGSSLQARVVHHGIGRGAGAAAALRSASCPCCSSCPRSSCGRAAARSELQRSRSRPRVRREMRALLALRARRCRPIRPRPGICDRCQDALAEAVAS